MARRGYLRGDMACQLVGAEDDSREKSYFGPCAQVTFDETWLHIVTDSYEGHAMLNIEALPYLQKALRRIAHARKTSKA